MEGLEAAGNAPRAYAVYVDEADTVWVSDFTANAVVNFDPATEQFTATYPGSGPNANVRQILGRKGEVLLPESGLDRVVVVRTDAAGAGGRLKNRSGARQNKDGPFRGSVNRPGPLAADFSK